MAAYRCASTFTAEIAAVEQLSQARFDAMQRAVDKALEATERRFEVVNEFRATLSDQGARPLYAEESFSPAHALAALPRSTRIFNSFRRFLTEILQGRLVGGYGRSGVAKRVTFRPLGEPRPPTSRRPSPSPQESAAGRAGSRLRVIA